MVYADISTEEAKADRRRRTASKIVVWSSAGLILFAGAFMTGYAVYERDLFIKQQATVIEEQAATIADLALRNQACTGAAANAEALNEAWHAWAREESQGATDEVNRLQDRIGALGEACHATMVVEASQ